ncbi:hypothetical protein KNO15_08910 [Leifsonia shinshuensis]|uniref:hypothetical protein n=1 Tax=Leifsonia shinshuensis TaxID=150026 RepID=UPI001F509788|nr:hypothetical protein [Leifsonia shinshuensis]MCI0156815.1 hypothetical protein [Leifsonia shinshuensis]
MQRTVGYLLDRLGTPLVSYLAVTPNKMDAWMWAEPSTGPTPEQERRVRCAYQAWKILERWKRDDATKAWFADFDPVLGSSPVDRIRSDEFDVVISAAKRAADLELVRYAERGDPVVIYDVMREAANRCAAAYVARITRDPDEHAIDQVRRVWSYAEGIDPRDALAQLRATDLLYDLRGRLVAGEDPDLDELFESDT